MARPRHTAPAAAPELPLTPATDAGAAGCLAFLQRQELEARQPILDARAALDALLVTFADPANDGIDEKDKQQQLREAQTRLSIARDEHRAASAAMKSYETIVSPEKRGDGEKVTQQEAAAQVTMIFTNIRFGARQFIVSSAQGSLLQSSEVAMIKYQEPLFDSAINSAIDNALIEGQIPKYMADAVRAVF